MPKPLLYGFLQHRDIMQQPITDAMVPVINRAINATFAEYNSQLDALVGLFAEKTTKFKFKFKTHAAKTLQDLDENGRARPTSGVGYYDVAFPLFAAGDAWGANFVTQQKLKPQDINDWLTSTLSADRSFMSYQLVRALLADRAYTYDDGEHGELKIMPLANGDAQEYLIRVGHSASATDNHLLAQAAPISDAADPFRMIRRELTEHPENGGETARVIVLAPYEQVEAIQSLSGFREVRDEDIEPALSDSFLTGALDVNTPGVVRGKVDNCWIVEWASCPEDRLIAVPTAAGGDAALAQREHEEASLQGFIELPERQDSPFTERQFQRHTGFGGHNRVGALAMQIGEDEYSSPPSHQVPVTE